MRTCRQWQNLIQSRLENYFLSMGNQSRERSQQLTILFALQAVILLGGVIFSWRALFLQFNAFYAIYGDILRVKDCVIPNPITTPCFYGSVAFIVALAWAVVLLRIRSEKSLRYLRNFLIFGVCFALAALAYEAVQYYYPSFSGPKISCNPGEHPLKTPCFSGLLFFVMAAFTSVLANKSEI